MTSGTCKYCKKPIADDVNGFCASPDDTCWKAWCAQVATEPTKPTASYKVTPEVVDELRARGVEAARERFFNEVLGEPFASKGES
jgi:hypothetical protein